MARIDLPTQIEGPDEIKINLVREDYLETSNIFRTFFEVCLAIGTSLLGNIIGMLDDNKDIPFLNWIFLVIMFLGCLVFLFLKAKYYKMAKSQSQIPPKPYHLQRTRRKSISGLSFFYHTNS